MGLDPGIAAVLDRHFPRSARDETTRLPEELERLLVSAGLDPDKHGPAEASLIDAVASAVAAGFSTDALMPNAQAYGRGLGRIVAAESDNIRRLLKAKSADEHAALLDEVLGAYLSASHEVLDALHDALLRDALEDALNIESLAEPDQPDRVIALIDLCGSTPYLTTADRDDTRGLVDALYEAGRTAEIGRAVWTVKYVGDGVFLVGRDAQEVTEASLQAIAMLEDLLPLRARAGLARGPVVRRAGDYFGPVVNLAQRLTTVAAPGVVVAAEPAASSIDDALVTQRCDVEVRGFDRRVRVAIVEQPRSASGPPASPADPA